MCDRCHQPTPGDVRRAYEAVCNVCGGRAVAVITAGGVVDRAYHPASTAMEGREECPALTGGVDLPVDGVQPPPVVAALMSTDALLAELEARGALVENTREGWGIITGPDGDPDVHVGAVLPLSMAWPLRFDLKSGTFPEGARVARQTTRWLSTAPTKTWDTP